MINVSPVIYRDADTLNPSDLRRTFEYCRASLDDALRHRWVHSCFVLDYKDLAQSPADGTNEGVFKVQPPAVFGAWEIVGVELRVAAASGTHTLVVANGGTTAETLTLTATDAAVHTLEQKTTNIKVAAAAEVTFTLTGYATVAVANAQVTVHIRSDRLGGTIPDAFTPPSIQDGSVLDGTTDIAAQFTNWETDADLHNTSTRALRIEVYSMRNNTVSNPPARTFDLPATGSKLDSFGAYLLQSSDDTLFRVTDTDTATNYDATVAAGADANTFASTVETTVNATQVNDDPDDTADSWTVTIDSSGATTDVKRAYIVLYWEV